MHRYVNDTSEFLEFLVSPRTLFLLTALVFLLQPLLPLFGLFHKLSSFNLLSFYNGSTRVQSAFFCIIIYRARQNYN